MSYFVGFPHLILYSSSSNEESFIKLLVSIILIFYVRNSLHEYLQSCYNIVRVFLPVGVRVNDGIMSVVNKL